MGCRPQASVVFRDTTFQDNPDLQDPRYSTELGMYQPHCGLENVLMSWGHDGEARWRPAAQGWPVVGAVPLGAWR